MIEATRRIQFCAGHRVCEHESVCRNLHGHNYVAFFTAIGIDSDVDKLGRVIDFGVLKEKLGGWIFDNWDHAFIVAEFDDLAKMAVHCMGDNHRTFIMLKNPTAENMARYLLDVVAPEVLKGTGVLVIKVVLWETENCYAEARV